MNEPWKAVICSARNCMLAALDSAGKVREEFRLNPDVDTKEETKFICPRCGKIEIWGPTRRRVAKILYERLKKE